MPIAAKIAQTICVTRVDSPTAPTASGPTWPIIAIATMPTAICKVLSSVAGQTIRKMLLRIAWGEISSCCLPSVKASAKSCPPLVFAPL